MSINQYNHDRLVNILEKSSFRDHGVNRLLNDAKQKEGKLELKDDKIIFTPKKGKTITVDLVKAQNTKRWTFSRFFQYSRKSDSFKKDYHDKIDAFVKKLLQPEAPEAIPDSINKPTKSENSSHHSILSKSDSSEESSEDPIALHHQVNPPVSPEDVPSEPEMEPIGLINKFSPDQMKTFSTILSKAPGKKISIPIEGDALKGDSLYVWFNPAFNAVNLQYSNYFNAGSQEEKLGLIIDDAGKITSIYVAGESHPDLNVPDEYEPLVKICYYESLKRSSNYSYNGFANAVDIKAISHGVTEIPEDHLSKLCPLIDNAPETVLKIVQLTSNLEVAPGSDAGGPARDFLDNLGKGLKQSKVLRIITPKAGSLAFPMTKVAGNGANPSPLAFAESSHYNNIGALLMFCYNSNDQQNYCIGQCFHPSILWAALSLKADEISAPSLSLASQKKMLQALLTSAMNDYPTSNVFNGMIKALELYDWVPGQPVPDDKVLSAAHDLLGNSLNGYDAYYKFMGGTEDDPDYIPDLDKIKAGLEEFVKAARGAILTQNMDELPYLGDCLEPIHQMARGMKEMCSLGAINQNDHIWNTKFNQLDFVEFNKKAQGSLNRDEIVSKFSSDIMPAYQGLSTGKNEIEKKIEWLKEWIKEKDTTSNEELEAFLKFATGSSSLAPNARIIFQYMDSEGSQPWPISHSCFNRVELSQNPCGNDEYNDHTKEGFIKCLKAAIEPGGAAFTMV